MASLGRILSKTFFWSYERGTWQYDVAVILILVFVLLTPRNWFRDLPALPLYGFAAVPDARHALHVEAVTEGDRVEREYELELLPPAEWVHGDPERAEMMPEDRYRSLPAGAPAARGTD